MSAIGSMIPQPPAFMPGRLVTFRGRDWVVLPSGDAELLLLRPLGGGREWETDPAFEPATD